MFELYLSETGRRFWLHLPKFLEQARARCNAASAPSMARCEVRGTPRTPGIPREARDIRRAPRGFGGVRRPSLLSLSTLGLSARHANVKLCAAGARGRAGRRVRRARSSLNARAARAAVVSCLFHARGGIERTRAEADGAMSRAMTRAREETPGTRRRRACGAARRRGCGARARRKNPPSWLSGGIERRRARREGTTTSTTEPPRRVRWNRPKSLTSKAQHPTCPSAQASATNGRLQLLRTAPKVPKERRR